MMTVALRGLMLLASSLKVSVPVAAARPVASTVAKRDGALSAAVSAHVTATSPPVQ